MKPIRGSSLSVTLFIFVVFVLLCHFQHNLCPSRDCEEHLDLQTQRSLAPGANRLHHRQWILDSNHNACVECPQLSINCACDGGRSGLPSSSGKLGINGVHNLLNSFVNLFLPFSPPFTTVFLNAQEVRLDNDEFRDVVPSLGPWSIIIEQTQRKQSKIDAQFNTSIHNLNETISQLDVTLTDKLLELSTQLSSSSASQFNVSLSAVETTREELMQLLTVNVNQLNESLIASTIDIVASLEAEVNFRTAEVALLNLTLRDALSTQESQLTQHLAQEIITRHSLVQQLNSTIHLLTDSLNTQFTLNLAQLNHSLSQQLQDEINLRETNIQTLQLLIESRNTERTQQIAQLNSTLTQQLEDEIHMRSSEISLLNSSLTSMVLTLNDERLQQINALSTTLTNRIQTLNTTLLSSIDELSSSAFRELIQLNISLSDEVVKRQISIECLNSTLIELVRLNTVLLQNDIFSLRDNLYDQSLNISMQIQQLNQTRNQLLEQQRIQLEERISILDSSREEKLQLLNETLRSQISFQGASLQMDISILNQTLLDQLERQLTDLTSGIHIEMQQRILNVQQLNDSLSDQLLNEAFTRRLDIVQLNTTRSTILQNAVEDINQSIQNEMLSREQHIQTLNTTLSQLVALKHSQALQKIDTESQLRQRSISSLNITLSQSIDDLSLYFTSELSSEVTELNKRLDETTMLLGLSNATLSVSDQLEDLYAQVSLLRNNTREEIEVVKERLQTLIWNEIDNRQDSIHSLNESLLTTTRQQFDTAMQSLAQEVEIRTQETNILNSTLQQLEQQFLSKTNQLNSTFTTQLALEEFERVTQIQDLSSFLTLNVEEINGALDSLNHSFAKTLFVEMQNRQSEISQVRDTLITLSDLQHLESRTLFESTQQNLEQEIIQRQSSIELLNTTLRLLNEETRNLTLQELSLMQRDLGTRISEESHLQHLVLAQLNATLLNMLDSSEQQLQGALGSINTTLHEEIATRTAQVHELEQNFAQDMQLLNETLRQELSSLNTTILTLTGVKTMDIINDILSLNASITSSIRSQEQMFETQLHLLQQELNDFNATFLAVTGFTNMQNLETFLQLNTTIESLQSRLTQSMSNMRQDVLQLSDFVLLQQQTSTVELTQMLQEEVSNRIIQIQSVNASLSQELIEQRDALRLSLQSEIDARIVTIAQLNNSLHNLQKFTVHLEETNSLLNSSLLTRINDEALSLSEQLGSEVFTRENEISRLNSSLTIMQLASASELKQLVLTLNETLSHDLASLAANFDTKLSLFSHNTSASLEQLRIDNQEQLSSLNSSLLAFVELRNLDRHVEISIVNSSLTASLQDAIHARENAVSSLNTNIADMGDLLTQRINVLNQTLIMDLWTESTTRLVQMQQLESQLTILINYTRDVQGLQIENLSAQLGLEIDNRVQAMEQLEQSLVQLNDFSQLIVENRFTDVEAIARNISQNLFEEIEERKAQVQLQQGHFITEIDNLSTALSSLNKSLKAIVSESSLNINSKIVNEIEARQMQIQSLNDSLLASLEEQSTLFHELYDNQQQIIRSEIEKREMAVANLSMHVELLNQEQLVRMSALNSTLIHELLEQENYLLQVQNTLLQALDYSSLEQETRWVILTNHLNVSQLKTESRISNVTQELHWKLEYLQTRTLESIQTLNSSMQDLILNEEVARAQQLNVLNETLIRELSDLAQSVSLQFSEQITLRQQEIASLNASLIERQDKLHERQILMHESQMQTIAEVNTTLFTYMVEERTFQELERATLKNSLSGLMSNLNATLSGRMDQEILSRQQEVMLLNRTLVQLLELESTTRIANVESLWDNFHALNISVDAQFRETFEAHFTQREILIQKIDLLNETLSSNTVDSIQNLSDALRVELDQQYSVLSVLNLTLDTFMRAISKDQTTQNDFISSVQQNITHLLLEEVSARELQIQTLNSSLIALMDVEVDLLSGELSKQGEEWVVLRDRIQTLNTSLNDETQTLRDQLSAEIDSRITAIVVLNESIRNYDSLSRELLTESLRQLSQNISEALHIQDLSHDEALHALNNTLIQVSEALSEDIQREVEVRQAELQQLGKTMRQLSDWNTLQHETDLIGVRTDISVLMNNITIEIDQLHQLSSHASDYFEQKLASLNASTLASLEIESSTRMEENAIIQEQIANLTVTMIELTGSNSLKALSDILKLNSTFLETFSNLKTDIEMEFHKVNSTVQSLLGVDLSIFSEIGHLNETILEFVSLETQNIVSKFDSSLLETRRSLLQALDLQSLQTLNDLADVRKALLDTVTRMDQDISAVNSSLQWQIDQLHIQTMTQLVTEISVVRHDIQVEIQNRTAALMYLNETLLDTINVEIFQIQTVISNLNASYQELQSMNLQTFESHVTLLNDRINLGAAEWAAAADSLNNSILNISSSAIPRLMTLIVDESSERNASIGELSNLIRQSNNQSLSQILYVKNGLSQMIEAEIQQREEQITALNDTVRSLESYLAQELYSQLSSLNTSLRQRIESEIDNREQDIVWMHSLVQDTNTKIQSINNSLFSTANALRSTLNEEVFPRITLLNESLLFEVSSLREWARSTTQELNSTILGLLEDQHTSFSSDMQHLELSLIELFTETTNRLNVSVGSLQTGFEAILHSFIPDELSRLNSSLLNRIEVSELHQENSLLTLQTSLLQVIDFQSLQVATNLRDVDISLAALDTALNKEVSARANNTDLILAAIHNLNQSLNLALSVQNGDVQSHIVAVQESLLYVVDVNNMLLSSQISTIHSNLSQTIEIEWERQDAKRQELTVSMQQMFAAHREKIASLNHTTQELGSSLSEEIVERKVAMIQLSDTFLMISDFVSLQLLSSESSQEEKLNFLVNDVNSRFLSVNSTVTMWLDELRADQESRVIELNSSLSSQLMLMAHQISSDSDALRNTLLQSIDFIQLELMSVFNVSVSDTIAILRDELQGQKDVLEAQFSSKLLSQSVALNEVNLTLQGEIYSRMQHVASVNATLRNMLNLLDDDVKSRFLSLSQDFDQIMDTQKNSSDHAISLVQTQLGTVNESLWLGLTSQEQVIFDALWSLNMTLRQLLESQSLDQAASLMNETQQRVQLQYELAFEMYTRSSVDEALNATLVSLVSNTSSSIQHLHTLIQSESSTRSISVTSLKSSLTHVVDFVHLELKSDILDLVQSLSDQGNTMTELKSSIGTVNASLVESIANQREGLTSRMTQITEDIQQLNSTLWLLADFDNSALIDIVAIQSKIETLNRTLDELNNFAELSELSSINATLHESLIQQRRDLEGIISLSLLQLNSSIQVSSALFHDELSAVNSVLQEEINSTTAALSDIMSDLTDAFVSIHSLNSTVELNYQHLSLLLETMNSTMYALENFAHQKVSFLDSLSMLETTQRKEVIQALNSSLMTKEWELQQLIAEETTNRKHSVAVLEDSLKQLVDFTSLTFSTQSDNIWSALHTTNSSLTAKLESAREKLSADMLSMYNAYRAALVHLNDTIASSLLTETQVRAEADGFAQDERAKLEDRLSQLNTTLASIQTLDIAQLSSSMQELNQQVISMNTSIALEIGEWNSMWFDAFNSMQNSLTMAVDFHHLMMESRFTELSETVAHRWNTTLDLFAKERLLSEAHFQQLNSSLIAFQEELRTDVQSLTLALETEISNREKNLTALQQSLSTLSGSVDDEHSQRLAQVDELQGGIQTLNETIHTLVGFSAEETLQSINSIQMMIDSLNSTLLTLSSYANLEAVGQIEKNLLQLNDFTRLVIGSEVETMRKVFEDQFVAQNFALSHVNTSILRLSGDIMIMNQTVRSNIESESLLRKSQISELNQTLEFEKVNRKSAMTSLQQNVLMAVDFSMLQFSSSLFTSEQASQEALRLRDNYISQLNSSLLHHDELFIILNNTIQLVKNDLSDTSSSMLLLASHADVHAVNSSLLLLLKAEVSSREKGLETVMATVTQLVDIARLDAESSIENLSSLLSQGLNDANSSLNSLKRSLTHSTDENRHTLAALNTTFTDDLSSHSKRLSSLNASLGSLESLLDAEVSRLDSAVLQTKSLLAESNQTLALSISSVLGDLADQKSHLENRIQTLNSSLTNLSGFNYEELSGFIDILQSKLSSVNETLSTLSNYAEIQSLLLLNATISSEVMNRASEDERIERELGSKIFLLNDSLSNYAEKETVLLLNGTISDESLVRASAIRRVEEEFDSRVLSLNKNLTILLDATAASLSQAIDLVSLEAIAESSALADMTSMLQSQLNTFQSSLNFVNLTITLAEVDIAMLKDTDSILSLKVAQLNSSLSYSFEGFTNALTGLNSSTHLHIASLTSELSSLNSSLSESFAAHKQEVQSGLDWLETSLLSELATATSSLNLEISRRVANVTSLEASISGLSFGLSSEKSERTAQISELRDDIHILNSTVYTLVGFSAEETVRDIDSIQMMVRSLNSTLLTLSSYANLEAVGQIEKSLLQLNDFTRLTLGTEIEGLHTLMNQESLSRIEMHSQLASDITALRLNITSLTSTLRSEIKSESLLRETSIAQLNETLASERIIRETSLSSLQQNVLMAVDFSMLQFSSSLFTSEQASQEALRLRDNYISQLNSSLLHHDELFTILNNTIQLVKNDLDDTVSSMQYFSKHADLQSVNSSLRALLESEVLARERAVDSLLTTVSELVDFSILRTETARSSLHASQQALENDLLDVSSTVAVTKNTLLNLASSTDRGLSTLNSSLIASASTNNHRLLSLNASLISIDLLLESEVARLDWALLNVSSLVDISTSTLSSSLSLLQSDLSLYKTQLEDRIRNLNSSLTNVVFLNYVELSAQISGLHERIFSFNSSLLAVENELEKKLSSVNESATSELAALRERDNLLESSLDTLNGSIVQIRTLFSENLNSVKSSLAQAVDLMSLELQSESVKRVEDVAQLSDDISALRTGITFVNNSMSTVDWALTAEVEERMRMMSSLNESLLAAVQSLSLNLNASVESLKYILYSDLSDMRAELKTTLSLHTTNLTELGGTVDSLTSALNTENQERIIQYLTLQEGIETLNKTVHKLTGFNPSDTSNQLTSIRGVISSFNETLQNIPSLYASVDSLVRIERNFLQLTDFSRLSMETQIESLSEKLSVQELNSVSLNITITQLRETMNQESEQRLSIVNQLNSSLLEKFASLNDMQLEQRADIIALNDTVVKSIRSSSQTSLQLSDFRFLESMSSQQRIRESVLSNTAQVGSTLESLSFALDFSTLQLKSDLNTLNQLLTFQGEELSTVNSSLLEVQTLSNSLTTFSLSLGSDMQQINESLAQVHIDQISLNGTVQSLYNSLETQLTQSFVTLTSRLDTLNVSMHVLTNTDDIVASIQNMVLNLDAINSTLSSFSNYAELMQLLQLNVTLAEEIENRIASDATIITSLHNLEHSLREAIDFTSLNLQSQIIAEIEMRQVLEASVHDDLTAYLQKVQQLNGTVSSQTQALTQTLETLQNDISNLNSSLRVLVNSNSDAHLATLETLQSTILQLSDLQELRSITRDEKIRLLLENEIDTRKVSVSSINGTLDELKQSLNILNSTLENSYTMQAEELESVHFLIVTVNTTLFSLLERNSDSHTATITSLNSSLQEQLTTLESTVISDFAERDGLMTSLQTSVTELRMALNTTSSVADTTFDILNNNIQQLNASLWNLSTGDASTLSLLKQLNSTINTEVDARQSAVSTLNSTFVTLTDLVHLQDAWNSDFLSALNQVNQSLVVGNEALQNAIEQESAQRESALREVPQMADIQILEQHTKIINLVSELSALEMQMEQLNATLAQHEQHIEFLELALTQQNASIEALHDKTELQAREIDSLKNNVCFIYDSSCHEQCIHGFIIENQCLNVSFFEALSYNDSQLTCSQNGGTILNIANQTQNYLVREFYFGKMGLQDEFWIANNATQVGSDEIYSNWQNAFAEGVDEESCAYMSSNGKWRRGPCHETRHIVCQSG